MSADDGTYILQTYGPEYRIVYAHAIDNIYGQYDDENHNWFPNINGIVDYFGQSKVFTTIEDAWDAAYAIDEKNGWSELGTCLISEFSEYQFSDFEERYAAKEN
jgi:hypothetical protein